MASPVLSPNPSETEALLTNEMESVDFASLLADLESMPHTNINLTSMRPWLPFCRLGFSRRPAGPCRCGHGQSAIQEYKNRLDEARRWRRRVMRLMTMSSRTSAAQRQCATRAGGRQWTWRGCSLSSEPKPRRKSIMSVIWVICITISPHRHARKTQLPTRKGRLYKRLSTPRRLGRLGA